MALYDVLQKRVQEQRAAAVGTLNDSAQATTSSILGAKTGKAPATGGPKASSLQEGAANDNALQAIDTASATASLGAQEVEAKDSALDADMATQQAGLDATRRTTEQQLAAQASTTREVGAQKQALTLDNLASKEQMQLDKISSDAEQRVAALLSDKKLNENQIFDQFHQDSRELAFRRDAAQLEQLATTLALRDKAYINEINAIGVERNLTDDIDFQKETNRLIMGEEVSSVLTQIGFGEEQFDNQQAFERKMTSISIQDAIAMAQAEIKAGQTRQAIQGAVGIAGAGLDYAQSSAAVDKNTSREQQEKTLSGLKSQTDSYTPSTSISGEARDYPIV